MCVFRIGIRGELSGSQETGRNTCDNRGNGARLFPVLPRGNEAMRKMIYSVMTQEEFINVLDKKRYSYKIEGDLIVVTDKNTVDLESLTSLPPGVEFRNGGYVVLPSLTSLPSGVVFKNGEDVYLGYLIGRWLKEWKGNIKGIASKRLLNVMIKQGVFI